MTEYMWFTIWCRYSREADWTYIATCAKAASPLHLVGNGDIFAHTDYEAHLQQIPELAATMIARGALIKPWLFTEVLPDLFPALSFYSL